MNREPDIELEELFLEDQELYETANLMRSLAAPEAPLDPVFRSGLRRKLMAEAWQKHEKRGRRWWPSFGPAPRLTWAASLVGIFLIAFVAAAVVLNRSSSGPATPVSSLDGQRNVAVVVPIDINFSQPMDRSATEAAVKIEPATDLTYEWSNNNTKLTIKPASREGLAPNTQYVVTVGPGARTAGGTELAAAKAQISFVTAGLPSPAPTPVTTPTPVAKVSNERQVATLALGSPQQVGQWSPDGGTLYFIGGKGDLSAVGLSGAQHTLVPDGVKLFAVSPDGANLAYVRAGKVYRVASDGAGSPIELTTADPFAIAFTSVSPPQASAASGPGVAYYQANAIWKVTSPGNVTRIYNFTEPASRVQFSPAGDRLIYWQPQGAGPPASNKLVDLASGQLTDRGNAAGPGVSWAGDGSRVAGTDAQGVYVAGADGKNLVRVATRDRLGAVAAQPLSVAWSGAIQILISFQDQLWMGSTDGSAPQKVADGVFSQQVVSPGGTTVAFRRGSNDLFLIDLANGTTRSAAALLEDGSRQVAALMDARVKGQADQANSFLDDAGKKAYQQTGGLIVTGDPKLTRAYQVTGELTSNQPVSLRYVVRLVFSSGKLETAQSDETLTLVQDAGGKLMVHQVSATQRRPVGKGPEVVSVDVTPTGLTVLFDSDLDSKSVTGNVVLTDSNGKPVSLKYSVAYANRTVTVSVAAGLNPGQTYRLSVLTGLKDVSGRAIVAQYDFDFDGPAS